MMRILSTTNLLTSPGLKSNEASSQITTLDKSIFSQFKAVTEIPISNNDTNSTQGQCLGEAPNLNKLINKDSEKVITLVMDFHSNRLSKLICNIKDC